MKAEEMIKNYKLRYGQPQEIVISKPRYSLVKPLVIISGSTLLSLLIYKLLRRS